MKHRDLEDRGHALEEKFFRQQNEKLRKDLHEKKARECSIEELADASGIRDQAVLGRLVDAGVSVDTLAALSLVPLVHVAWADGNVDDAERAAILRAATECGAADGSSAHALLDSLLASAPDATLFSAWSGYVSAVKEQMTPADFAALGKETVSRARDVASAAGGFLGIGKVSEAETRALQAVEEAFGS